MITAEMCDICGNSAVGWPQIFTVIGPKNMCGDCYWRYRRLVEALAEYFDQARNT